MIDQPAAGNNESKRDDTKNNPPTYLDLYEPHAHQQTQKAESKYKRAARKLNPLPHISGWWKDTKWTDKTIALFTVVIAGAAILQWHEMRDAGTQTERIITAANLIECHLRQTVTDNENALTASKTALETTLSENRSELSKVLDQNRQSLQSGIAQSKAALDASIAASRLDQRPWVLAVNFQLSGEPEVGKEFKVTVSMENTGKTPGISVHSHEVLALWYTSAAPTPPDYPDPFTPTDTMGTQAVVPPVFPNLTPPTFDSDPLSPTKDQVDAYEAGTTSIYLHTRIDYKDSFIGSKPHWTQVCVFHSKGMPLNQFRFCKDWNNVDE